MGVWARQVLGYLLRQGAAEGEDTPNPASGQAPFLLLTRSHTHTHTHTRVPSRGVITRTRRRVSAGAGDRKMPGASMPALSRGMGLRQPHNPPAVIVSFLTPTTF